MAQHFTDIRSYQTRARDGVVGGVADLLFDDRSHLVRWLVVAPEDGGAGAARRVLAPSEGAVVDAELGEVRLDADAGTLEAAVSLSDAADPHLKSAAELVGCAVHTTDGRVGEVTDLVVETREDWRIATLFVEFEGVLAESRHEVPVEAINAYLPAARRIDVAVDDAAEAVRLRD
jgi:sporulation protein YlmC with PRC-barrel domain